MDIDAIFEKPAFSKMPDAQRAAFRGLVEKLGGRTVAEAIPIMMRFMSELPKGPPLSKEEQSAMTEAVTESLSEPERAKFRAMLSLAGKRK